VKKERINTRFPRHGPLYVYRNRSQKVAKLYVYIYTAAMIPTTIYIYIVYSTTVYTHQNTDATHRRTVEVKMRHTQTTKNNYFESHVQHLLSSSPTADRRLFPRQRRLLRSRRGESIYLPTLIYILYRIHLITITAAAVSYILYKRNYLSRDRGNYMSNIIVTQQGPRLMSNANRDKDYRNY